MPSGLSASDRKVLLVAGAAFIVLVVLGLLLAPSSNDSDIASSYSTASGGAKAAYLLLQETGYHVERWQRPHDDLKPNKNTVLIIADPQTVPDEKEKAAIEKFISGGGRLITNGIVGGSFLPEDYSEVNPLPASPWSEFNALMPSAITHAAPKITLSPDAFWGHKSGIPLYGNDDGIVAVRVPHGKGDAIWIASATPLTNAGMKQANNVEFFLAAIGDKGLAHILFDEYVHGYGEREAPEKSHPLFTALLLQSALLAAAILFTFSRRSGPLRSMPSESRLSPLEFVETLGGLYENVHAASVAVDIHFERFRFWITQRLGLSKDAAVEEIDHAVRDRWRLNDDNFLETLRNAASARYDPGLSQEHALRLVRSLHSYAVKLRLFSVSKEKN